MTLIVFKSMYSTYIVINYYNIGFKFTVFRNPTVIPKPVMNTCTWTCQNCTWSVSRDNMNPTINHYQ